MLVNNFLVLGAVLFCIGVYGVIVRKNASRLMFTELRISSMLISTITALLRAMTP